MIIIQFMVILTNLIAACIHSFKKKKQHDLIHFNKKKKKKAAGLTPLFGRRLLFSFSAVFN